jgi:acylphosphatase
VRARVRVLVSGDVQGVGFRWYTREQAAAAGVVGSVRNLPDGRVEAVFEGEREAVDRMVAWCRRGPRSARVRSVEVSDEPPEGDESFRITH